MIIIIQYLRLLYYFYVFIGILVYVRVYIWKSLDERIFWIPDRTWLILYPVIFFYKKER